MSTEAQAVLQQALRLAAVERAELIDALFRSLDKAGRRETDAAWAQEVESRIDAFDAGKIPADSAEAVLRRIDGR